MAQHDYIVANQSGAAFRADLNNALAAIVSQNSGAAAPSTTYSYMPWADTTAGVFKIRNAANNGWVSLYQLDGEWSNITLENGTAAEPSLAFKSGAGLFSPGTNRFAVETSGTQRLEVDASGRLLVGVSSSSANASAVFQGSSGGGAAAQLWLSNTGSSPADGEALGVQEFSDNGHIAAARIVARRDGGTWTSGSSHPARLEIVTTPTGTTSSEVTVTVQSNGNVTLNRATSSQGLRLGTTSTVCTDKIIFTGPEYFIVNGSAVGVRLGTGSTSWSAQSDERLKTNLAPISNALEKVDSLRAVTGRYKSDNESTSRSFLIAQDVQSVLPEAVDVGSDEDGTLSLRYTEVIPLLVGAIKESKARIEALEATLAA